MIELMSQASNVTHPPSDKERKYDRQLRLWAASGQAALESANILLINSHGGTAGVEVLKNLVLPGIGRFAIFDEATVTEADLGVNFFLDQSSLGKSRAQFCTELLLELNPEVIGQWHPHSEKPAGLEQLLNESDDFSLILCSMPLEARQIELVKLYAHDHQIPFVTFRTIGFYSYFRIHYPGVLPIVDTHPDETAIADLRLLDPWTELSDFSHTLTENIDSLDDYEHGHVPFVNILLHHLSLWKQSHDNGIPRTYAEKTLFRDTIAAAMRKNNVDGSEENFEEAIAAVMKYVTVTSVPPSLQQVFDFLLKHKSQCDSSFWLIAEGVRQFCGKHQQLPMPGRLPDMKAQPRVYAQLQKLYRNKARQDADEVFATVRALRGGESVQLAEVELFCKNAKFIKLVYTADAEKLTLQRVVENELANDQAVASSGLEGTNSLIPIYLALTVSEAQSPSTTTQGILDAILTQAPSLANHEGTAQVAQEVARCKSVELHNISALTGGMIAQEVIKVVTRQYIPIDNTCVFDGIASLCQVLRL